jgi:ribonuclease H / adenosylcobalamin/alpha-ribazole phosphatase
MKPVMKPEMKDERATTIYVVRHGRTTLNAQGRFRGLADPPMDETGLAEAEAVAARITARPDAFRPLAAIATSRLVRARQTAEAIGLAAGREPFVLDELIDLDHGRWQGLTPDEARALDPDEYRRFRRDPRSASAPGGEALADVEARMRSAIRSLATRYPGEEMVAVSHEMPIRLLVSGLRGLDGSQVWEFDLPTASVTTLIHTAESGWSAD